MANRKLTVDIDVIDPRAGDTFGFEVTNNGLPLIFTQSGQVDSIGWNKVYVTGGTSSSEIVLVDRLVKLDSNLGATSGYIGSIPNGAVNDLHYYLSGNSIIPVGSFTQWFGLSTVNVNRAILLSDNTTSYNTFGLGAGNNVNTVTMDSSANIYMGGDFSTFNGASINGIVKITGAGAVDNTFRTNVMSAGTKKGFNNGVGSGTVAAVRTIAVDNSTGKIYVGGDFLNFNKNTRNRIIRLNANGTKDDVFSIGTGFNNTVRVIKVQADGKVLVGGDFTAYKGTSCNKIVRLTNTGTIDPTFVFSSGGGNGFDDRVSTIKIDGATGNILIGGMFTTYKGVNRGGLVKVDALGNDLGTFGTAFRNPPFTNRVETIELDYSGKVLVGGNFNSYQGTTASCFVKLNADGSLNSKLDFNATVYTIKAKLDNTIYVGGSFTQYTRTSLGMSASNDLYHIPLVGDTSTTTISATGFSASITPAGGYSLLDNNDDTYMMVGGFTQYNGVTTRRVVKISATGSKDSSFVTPTPGFNDEAFKIIAATPSGYLVGGVFTQYKSVTSNSIAKISATGSLDTSFVTGSGFDAASTVYGLLKTSDDKYLAGGNFTSYKGTGANSIVRLSATGSLDTSFVYGTGFNDNVRCFYQTGSDYLVGGDFTTYKGVTNRGIVKISATGSLDTSFSFPAYSSWANDVYSITPFGSGYFISGLALGTASSLRTPLLLLSSTGSVDPSFNLPTTSLDQTGYKTIITDDNCVLMVGDFFTYKGVTAGCIVKLTATGSVDTSFVTGSGFDTLVYDVIKTDDGGYICSGLFSRYKGVTSSGIIKLTATGSIWPKTDQYVTTVATASRADQVYATYDNLVEFNTNPYGAGITYSILGGTGSETGVRMEYTFDEEEIVVQDIYDTPDHIEIGYTNTSITINERIREVVTRSDHKIQTIETDPFNYTNFKIRIYEGSLFSGVTASPVKYNITKPKIVSTQTNIYIDVSNLIREDFEWNIGDFYSSDITTATDLSSNICKWVYIEETNYLGTASVSARLHYLYAIDGYLLNNEIQHLPNILVNGTKRYVHRQQQQRIYFQSNFLVSITAVYEDGTTFSPTFDVNLPLDNTKYVQSLSIDTSNTSRWVDYIFNYGDTINTIRYYFYDGCVSGNYYELVYKNKWGVLESLAVNKKSKISLESKGDDYTRSIVDYNGNYDITRHTNKKFNVDMTETFMLNTDVIPAYMNDAIIDLYLSEEVWLKTDSEYVPIVIDGDIGDLKNRVDGPITYSIKAIISHQKIKNIL